MLSIKTFKTIIGCHITTNHTAKMEGLASLSTAVTINPNCKRYQACKGSICEKCYANAMSKQYKALNNVLVNNTEILTKTIINKDDLPLIPYLYFRFEAFGDLNNYIQVINYFNIAKLNPHTHFALWTKNPNIIAEAIAQGYKKPHNLQIILSSIFINKALNFERMRAKYPFIDKVFTVYDADTIESQNIDINCGARSCFKCHKCYTQNKIVYINEKLK